LIQTPPPQLHSCRCEVALREASDRGRNGDHGNGDHGNGVRGNDGGDGSQAFVEVLTENLHGLATSLPRLLRSTDDHKKLLVLNVFLGYLKLLGPLVSRVLSSAPHLHRISKALMQVCHRGNHHHNLVSVRCCCTIL